MAQGVTPAQIAIWARQRGLDPQAVLAVAQQEGLGGGIGDQGTSFGPWQLHYGGAYPSWAPQGQAASQAWAWSPQGVDYALRQQASVAGGLRGPAAVQALVSRFERPADIPGETARALQAYGGNVPAASGFRLPATAPAAAPAVQAPMRAPAPAPAPQPRQLPAAVLQALQILRS